MHTRTHTSGYVSKKTHRGGHNYCATGEEKKIRILQEQQKVSLDFSDFSIVCLAFRKKEIKEIRPQNSSVRLKFVGIVGGDQNKLCVYKCAAQMYKH